MLRTCHSKSAVDAREGKDFCSPRCTGPRPVSAILPEILLRLGVMMVESSPSGGDRPHLTAMTDGPNNADYLRGTLTPSVKAWRICRITQRLDAAVEAIKGNHGHALQRPTRWAIKGNHGHALQRPTRWAIKGNHGMICKGRRCRKYGGQAKVYLYRAPAQCMSTRSARAFPEPAAHSVHASVPCPRERYQAFPRSACPREHSISTRAFPSVPTQCMSTRAMSAVHVHASNVHASIPFSPPPSIRAAGHPPRSRQSTGRPQRPARPCRDDRLRLASTRRPPVPCRPRPPDQPG